MSDKSQQPQMPRATRIRMLRWLAALIVAAALVYTLRQAWRQLSEQPINWRDMEWRWLLLAVVGNAVMLCLQGCFWRQALVELGGRASVVSALRAFIWSQLGKYVPGKAMVMVMRVGLIRSEGTSLAAGLVSTLLETMMWVFVGSQIACLYFLISGFGGTGLRLLAVGLLVVSGILMTPKTLRSVAGVLERRYSQTGNRSTVRFSGGLYASGVALMLAAWLAAGASSWCVVRAMPGATIAVGDYWLIVAVVALATVVGFASLIPGGLGARELVIIPLLASKLPLPIAVAAAVMIRAVSMITEVLLSMAGEGIYIATHKRTEES